jgi:eukaryotic translation initiation factor 2C
MYKNSRFLAAVISPSEKTLPARLNMEIITHLQTMIAPGIFTPPVVYDGRKNIFAPRELPFADGVQEVCTPFPLPWSFLTTLSPLV